MKVLTRMAVAVVAMACLSGCASFWGGHRRGQDLEPARAVSAPPAPLEMLPEPHTTFAPDAAATSNAPAAPAAAEPAPAPAAPAAEVAARCAALRADSANAALPLAQRDQAAAALRQLDCPPASP